MSVEYSNQIKSSLFPISRVHIVQKNKEQKLKGERGSAREADPAYHAGRPSIYEDMWSN